MYLIPFFLRRLGHAAAILFCVVVTVVVVNAAADGLAGALDPRRAGRAAA